jgi:hypothetical protein
VGAVVATHAPTLRMLMAIVLMTVLIAGLMLMAMALMIEANN